MNNNNNTVKWHCYYLHWNQWTKEREWCVLQWCAVWVQGQNWAAVKNLVIHSIEVSEYHLTHNSHTWNFFFQNSITSNTYTHHNNTKLMFRHIQRRTHFIFLYDPKCVNIVFRFIKASTWDRTLSTHQVYRKTTYQHVMSLISACKKVCLSTQ